jgi:hypothetical protein
VVEDGATASYDAGSDRTVDEGDHVRLGPSFNQALTPGVTYTWTQVSGIPIALDDASAARPSFTAPEGLTNTVVEFQVTTSTGIVDTVTVTINRDNDAPLVDAGPAQEVDEGDTVTLAASASDPEGQGLTYTWTQVSGPAVVLTGGSSAAPSFVAPEGLTNTTIVFQCSVSDGTNTTVDTVSVLVNRDQDAPIIDAGADQSVDEGDPVSLSATASDPEGQTLHYLWTQTSGPPVVLVNANTAHATFVAPNGVSNSDVTFALRVTDGSWTVMDTVTVTVNAANDAPSVDAGDDITVDEEDEVTLHAYGTDPERQGLSYTWTQISGPTVALTGDQSQSLSFTAPNEVANTTLVFQVAASDGVNTSVDTVSVFVNADDDAPTANAGPNQEVAEGDVVTLAGSGTDPENLGLTYAWVQTSGPAVTLSDPTAASPTFTAPEGLANVTISFQLSVSDGTNTSVDSVSILVNRNNDAPTVDAGPTQFVEEGDAVALAATATDPEGAALTYFWSQVSGPSVDLTGMDSASPSFTAPEGLANTTLVFQVIVSDGENQTVDTVTVEVARDDDAPSVNAGLDRTVNEGASVALSATATDPEGVGLTYTWTQLAGPAVVISNATSASAGFVAPEGLTNTQLVFQVAVSDGTNTAIDTVTIDVNRDDDAPSANAGSDQSVDEGDTVTLQGSGTDPEGVPLTYTWVQTSGPAVVMSDANAAQPTFEAPHGLTNVTLGFQLTVSDGVNTSVDTVSILVNRDNDAPIVDAGPHQVVDENDTVQLSAAITETDGQATQIIWKQISGPTVTLTGANTATPTFVAPEGLTNTQVVFQAIVSDGSFVTTDTVTVDINRDDDAPTANAGPDQTVTEATVVTLSGSGSDPEGVGLTYTWTQVSGPTVAISNANSTTPTFVAPNELVNTDLVFQVAVSDGVNVSVDTVTIHVNADDDAPLVDAGANQTVDENDPVTLTATATDPEGEGLTYTWSQVSGPTVALTGVNTNALGFTAPELISNTTLVFQVAVSDGVNTTVDTVSVLVNANNDAPSVDAGANQEVDEGDPVSLAAVASDIEGQSLTYTWTQTSGPAVQLTGGSTATPSFTAPNYVSNTTLTFRVAVSDGTNTTFDTVSVLVNADNDAVTAEAGANQTVNENALVTLHGSGVDPESQTLTYTWVQTSGPAVTLSNAAAASPTFTAPEGLANTSVTFQLTVSDGVHSAVDTVTIDINRDDDAPIVNAGADRTVNENAPVTLTATATDPEGLPLTYVWTQTAGPSVALSNANAASMSFTAPERLANTTLTFQVAVSDGVNTTFDTINVVVNADNDAPIVDAGLDQTVTEGDAVALAATATDPEGQGITYTWTQVSGPTVALTGANSATPTFAAPNLISTQTLVFRVAAFDGVNTTFDTVSVVVQADNDGPSVDAGFDQTVDEGDAVSLGATASDPEGTALTYAWTQVGGPSVVLANANGAAPTFTAPNYVANTELTFQVTVSDGVNTSVDTVRVMVNADDDAPSVDAGPNQVVEENDVVTLAASASDPEGQGLTYTWTQVAGPSVVLSSSSATSPSFTAPEGLSNTQLVFQVSVSDGTNTTIDTVTIDVNRDNDAPSVDAGANQVVDENDVVTLAATASDPEGQGLTYTWTQVAGPSVVLSSTSATSPTFTAPEGLSNTQLVFQVSVTDGTNTTIDTVTIDVNRDNDAPSVDAGPNQSVDENDVVTLAATATDPEGQGLTYTWTQVAGPSVALSSTSATSPTFTAPEGLSNTQLVFQVSVTDGTNTTIDTVTIDVNRDNDAPSVDAGAPFSVTEMQPAQLSASASDVEGQALTYTWTQVSGPAVTLVNAHSATPTFTAPGCPLDTTLRFQVAVSDGTNVTYDTVDVLVVAVNQDPENLRIDGTEIAPDAVNGTVIGRVSADDGDTGDVLRYSLTGGDSRFAIDPVTGELTVADANRLERYGTNEYVITVRATDLSGAIVEREIVLTMHGIAAPTLDEKEADDERGSDESRSEREVAREATPLAPALVTSSALSGGDAEPIERSTDDGAPSIEIAPVTFVAWDGRTEELVQEMPVPIELSEPSPDLGIASRIATIEFGDEPFEAIFEEIIEETRREANSIAAEVERAVDAPVAPPSESSASSMWALLWGALRGVQGSEREAPRVAPGEDRGRSRSQK